ncbi:MAG: ATP synthase F1 subunit gamma [Planctomycetota bacterium]|nr:MAG: ATP synthase F1 subunit gamma [Planctomycetota bacterium]
MANVRDLKVRIKSIGNIRQITRAMEMVATTKLRRFQDRALAAGPYSDQVEQLVASLAAMLGGENEHPLFEEREGKKIAVLVVGSDRGLCGAYNSNISTCIRDWMLEMKESLPGAELSFFAVGARAVSTLQRRGLKVEQSFEDPKLEHMDYADTAAIARFFVESFLNGDFDQVKICSTRFESLSRFNPGVHSFLPLSQLSAGEGDESTRELILEPSRERIFEAVVPKYLETRMFALLLQALTAEYASRMISMKNATEAAGDMQGQLKKQYNRARQERITKELLDIVGGAEAIAG